MVAQLTDVASQLATQRAGCSRDSFADGAGRKVIVMKVLNLVAFVLAQVRLAHVRFHLPVKLHSYTCDNFGDPTQPQKLFRIYSTCDNNRSVLVLASQLASGSWPLYTGSCGTAEPAWTATEIGYAFSTVDSDGDTLPDGLERLYDMMPTISDSDCDGIPDGVEFPVFGVQNVGSDPKDGVCP